MEDQSEYLDHQVQGYRVPASRLAESNFRYTQRQDRSNFERHADMAWPGALLEHESYGIRRSGRALERMHCPEDHSFERQFMLLE